MFDVPVCFKSISISIRHNPALNADFAPAALPSEHHVMRQNEPTKLKSATLAA